jgi:hypothetical protein
MAVSLESPSARQLYDQCVVYVGLLTRVVLSLAILGRITLPNFASSINAPEILLTAVCVGDRGPLMAGYCA